MISKINFINKKYYFNIFLNKKYLKKQSLPLYRKPAIHLAFQLPHLRRGIIAGNCGVIFVVSILQF
jgi:hypothetical protein